MENDYKKSTACGLLVLYNAFFRRRTSPVSPCRTSATPNADETSAAESGHNPKRRRSGHDQPPAAAPKASKALVSPKHAIIAPTLHQLNWPSAGRALRSQISGISAELDNMIYDHQRAKGSSTLVRASSGNVMLYSNLGNLRAPGAVTPNRNVLDYLPKTAAEEMEPSQRHQGDEPKIPVSMCRALSRRLSPEELKELGNDEYKNGRYAEAVTFYDRAILIDPKKASYWSNKAAALIGLGLLLEALQECKEAIRIDPCYLRAHQRVATLYLRLGEPEKAVSHYKLAKSDANFNDISRAKAVQVLISKCSETRKLKDWTSVLKESQSAIAAGADSALQIFAYQAEAFLMLLRPEDAEETMIDAPKFEMDAATVFFGAPSNAYQLSIRAQVDMAAGRFETAVALAQTAARMDHGSREISVIARKARSVASARSKGNDLFKAFKFEEACLVYGNGLNHDPSNAILLCNRAACWSKLEQWEKAIEDCNVALNLRPKYSKARLRRADCNAKLERWEASLHDYELLALEMPVDEAISKTLLEVKAHVGASQRKSVKEKTCSSAVIHITSKDQYHRAIASYGLSIALFYDQSSEDCEGLLSYFEQLSKRYTSATFLKVNVEEQASFERWWEKESSPPIFKIYKNGSPHIADIDGSDLQQLERSLLN